MKTTGLIGLLALTLLCATSVKGQTLEWTEQFGTGHYDRSFGISTDLLGNVYVSGDTYGNLGGPIAGNSDAFLAKFDTTGSLLWTKQLGTSDWDASNGVSVDSLGNVYISGRTSGSLGGPNAGGYDAFLAKYDATGTLQWTEQLGTDRADESWGVSADSLGNVFISGKTQGSLGGPNAGGDDDAFLAKYDGAGTLQWIEQLGTARTDESRGVSADSLGNVYISGFTYGSLGGPNAGNSDAFLAKYDAAGTLLWTEQLGTGNYDYSFGVSADSFGNVYVSGDTKGSLGGPIAGSRDAFLAKYDAAGTLLWTEQLGTSSWDVSYGVSADSLGNVYISGRTSGSLGGPSAGAEDSFLAKYDADGTLLWTEQLGTDSSDFGRGVSVDLLGNAYISGYTNGSLSGPNAGRDDVFLAKYAVPEPGSVCLAILASAGLLLVRRR